MPPPPVSRLQVETLGGVIVARLLDSAIAEDYVLNEVRDALEALVLDRQAPRVLLDLGRVRRYSTGLLGHLLALQSRVKSAHGTLKLCSLAPNLADALRILHLEKLFAIYPDERAALDSFEDAEGSGSGSGPFLATDGHGTPDGGPGHPPCSA